MVLWLVASFRVIVVRVSLIFQASPAAIASQTSVSAEIPILAPDTQIELLFLQLMSKLKDILRISQAYQGELKEVLRFFTVIEKYDWARRISKNTFTKKVADGRFFF